MVNQYYINTGNPCFAWIKRKSLGDPGRAHRSFLTKNCTGTRHPVHQNQSFLSTDMRAAWTYLKVLSNINNLAEGTSMVFEVLMEK